MLLANLEPEVAALLAALTTFVVILTTVVQTWFMGWRADQRERRAKQLAAAKSAADQLALDEAAAKVVRETKAAAAKVADAATKAADVAACAMIVTQNKVDKVYGEVNGEGLGGKLKEMGKQLTDHTQALLDHAKDDSAKFHEIKAEVEKARLTTEEVRDILKRLDERGKPNS